MYFPFRKYMTGPRAASRAASTNRQASIAGQGRRRARQPVPRTLRVESTLTDEEYAVMAAAAGLAGCGAQIWVFCAFRRRGR